ncbi:hypothetical protein HK102_014170 [Quaeritorhiza haematococci]|nr:hypothetical protein HK102_014170 [Quaeritorhiza haematococci]
MSSRTPTFLTAILVLLLVCLSTLPLATAAPQNTVQQDVNQAVDTVSNTVKDVSRQVTNAVPSNVPEAVNGAIQDVSKSVNSVASQVAGAVAATPTSGAVGVAGSGDSAMMMSVVGGMGVFGLLNVMFILM